MKVPKISMPEKLRASVPAIRWPQIGRTVDIPVYLVHNAPDPEDYYFIFDFEEFVEASRSGTFVRPRIKVWAGRRDFSRRQFAQQFRASFAQEFDAARKALEASEAQGAGWFGWLRGMDIAGLSLTGFAAQVVLLVAVSAGKSVWSALPLPRLGTGAGQKQKLEAEIEKTKTHVDEALEAMTITLHIDLLRYAFRDGGAKGLTDVDRDAWPLPDFVTRVLT